MADPRQRLRIIALGDPNRGDDAIGIVAARQLRDRLAAWVPIDEQTGGVDALIESWQGAETVIVIDAIRSGAPAGTLHRATMRGGINFRPKSSHAPLTAWAWPRRLNSPGRWANCPLGC